MWIYLIGLLILALVARFYYTNVHIVKREMLRYKEAF